MSSDGDRDGAKYSNEINPDKWLTKNIHLTWRGLASHKVTGSSPLGKWLSTIMIITIHNILQAKHQQTNGLSDHPEQFSCNNNNNNNDHKLLSQSINWSIICISSSAVGREILILLVSQVHWTLCLVAFVYLTSACCSLVAWFQCVLEWRSLKQVCPSWCMLVYVCVCLFVSPLWLLLNWLLLYFLKRIIGGLVLERELSILILSILNYLLPI